MRILLLLFCFNVSAESWIHAGMWSKHVESGLNETHDLIGIEIDGYFIYKFENSQYDTAYYLGQIKRDGYCLGASKLCLGYSYGIMQGYDFKRLSPIAFGVLSYEKYGIGADISCLPGTVCSFQLRFSAQAFENIGLSSPFETDGYIEISLDHSDPDGEGKYGFNRNNGASYDFKLYLTNDVYLKGGYISTDSDASPDQNDEKFQSTWITKKPSKIDSRGSFQIGKDFKYLSIGLSINQVSIQENTINLNTWELTSTPKARYRGYGVHFSKDYQLTDNFTLYAEAAIIDDLITDLRLTFESRYKIAKNLEVTLRTIDYERWNYSQYQAGIRYNF